MRSAPRRRPAPPSCSAMSAAAPLPSGGKRPAPDAWRAAQLFFRRYRTRLTRRELFMVMAGGMAGIAGTVFVLYATILRSAIPDVAGHILVASILSAPAALRVSQLMVPESAGEASDAGCG